MAIFSTHLLNSVNGTHADNVKVDIYKIDQNKNKKKYFDGKTDEKGRISVEFDLTKEDCLCDYEMVCKTGDYFSEKKIVSEIIVKFKMVDPKKKYHLPIIISPNGYSIWWSK